MPRTPHVTRQRRDRDEGLTDFAALELDLTREDERDYAKATMSVSRRTAKEAWKWYDRIGEVKFSVNRNARVGGYAELAAYELNADGTIGKKITGNSKAAQIARGIYSRFGGQRALIERFILMAKVPGDCYLIRTHDPAKNPDGYDFCSSDELEMVDLDGQNGVPGKIKRKMLPKVPTGSPDGGIGYEEYAPGDFLGRIWRPGGQYAHMPDSPLYALDDVCEILWLLTRGLKGKLRNRLAMNGVFYIPQEINKIKSAATKAGEGSKLHQNELIDQFLKAATFAILNHDKEESALPVFAVGPGDQSENLKFIEPERQILETEIKLRAELIDRLLFGLDIDPVAVKGSGEANHWGSWAATDDERRVSVQPDLETMCWALTRLVLWPEMQRQNVASGTILKTVIWYDLSRGTAKSNLAEDARQAYDRGAITLEELLRYSGMAISEMPTEQDQIRWFGREYGDPYLAFFVGGFADIDYTKVTAQPKPGPDADPGKGGTPKAGPGKGDPGSPNPSDRKTDTPRRKRPA